ncbi:hypothetical protein [Dongia sp.]|uniref:hypothetical protein n=1 Tax=Dongia sp. TaxID=1977262 RepID=UPI0037520B13
MRFGTDTTVWGTISRVLVLAAVAALAAGCEGNGNKMNTSGPGANAGDNTRIATIPDAPAADTASLTPANQTFTIAKNIWDDYQLYLSRVGRIGNGYYAITTDGLGGASWSCSDALCGGSYNGKDLAMGQCQTSNPGKTCMIFAKDNHPQVKYEIAP